MTTMDSPSLWYRFWHRRSVHAFFVNATLRFVGFAPVRETTFFSQRSRTREQREAWIARMERSVNKRGDGWRIAGQRDNGRPCLPIAADAIRFPG